MSFLNYPVLQSIELYTAGSNVRAAAVFSAGYSNATVLVYLTDDKPISINSINPSWLRFATQGASTFDLDITIKSRWPTLFGHAYPDSPTRKAWIGYRFAHTDSGVSSKIYWYPFITSERGYIFQT